MNIVLGLRGKWGKRRMVYSKRSFFFDRQNSVTISPLYLLTLVRLWGSWYTWLYDSTSAYAPTRDILHPNAPSFWLLLIFTAFNVFIPTLVRNALCNSCLRVIIVPRLDQLSSQVAYSAAVCLVYIFNNNIRGAHVYYFKTNWNLAAIESKIWRLNIIHLMPLNRFLFEKVSRDRSARSNARMIWHVVYAKNALSRAYFCFWKKYNFFD